MDLLRIKTLKELRESGYTPRSVKVELRENLIKELKNKNTTMEGIIGYEDTVLPDLQTAILSQHNILLLGLRGQAKTRIARLMINLLDEYVPYIEGSELFEDPLNPISWFGHHILEIKGEISKLRVGYTHIVQAKDYLNKKSSGSGDHLQGFIEESDFYIQCIQVFIYIYILIYI